MPSYTTCQPNGGLPACGGGGCAHYPAPVIAFPDQPIAAAAAEVASEIRPDVLNVLQPITIVQGTYYQFSGANFVHVGESDYLSFSAHPRFPLSGLFQFQFRKYPLFGEVALDGSVVYQSRGINIREGDFVSLECVGTQRFLTQLGEPNPFNMPYVAAPQADVIDHFKRFGSQSPENLRIISDTFDPLVPPNEQPEVKTDGSKAYYIQFTRTGQNLALYPGQEPAPCHLKTSGYKGNGTRWLLLPVNWHYGLSRDAPTPQGVSEPVVVRPEDIVAGRGVQQLDIDLGVDELGTARAPMDGTFAAAIAQQRFGSQ